MILAASTNVSIGLVILAIVLAGWVVYVWGNIRRSRAEVGAEVELAPNRKPYLSDEELEGRKLERALTWGLLSLVIVAVGLPVYWLLEPSRQEAEAEQFEELARGDDLEHGKRAGGAALFATTEEGGFNCAGCHGPEGVGGVTEYTLTEAVVDDEGNPVVDENGQPETTVRVVTWQAPALNTVLLRFSADEVNRIITYGRKGTPMPAWGVDGGGPMNEQQVENLVAYLESIQISEEEAKEQAAEAVAGAVDGEAYQDLPADLRLGAAAFDQFCSRCHTQGWSYGEPEVRGGGAFGPSLRGGVEVRQFPTVEDHVAFVNEGSNFEELYGVRGIGSGRMPGFGRMLPEDVIEAIVEYERSL